MIFIECTFLFDDDFELASQKKHIHWKELKPHILAHPDTLFMLFHFSQRYDDEELAAFFEKEAVDNVKWW